MRVDVGKTALSPQAGIEDNSKESLGKKFIASLGHLELLQLARVLGQVKDRQSHFLLVTEA